MVDAIDAAVDALARADVAGRGASSSRASSPHASRRSRTTAPGRAAGARHPLLALDGVDGGAERLAVARGAGGGRRQRARTRAARRSRSRRWGSPRSCCAPGCPSRARRGQRVGALRGRAHRRRRRPEPARRTSRRSARTCKNLAAILDETRPGALVLLDELAGGTDPREGEALAAGVLDSLCARGGAVAATTHYEGLKALALADAALPERAASASTSPR